MEKLCSKGWCQSMKKMRFEVDGTKKISDFMNRIVDGVKGRQLRSER